MAAGTTTINASVCVVSPMANVSAADGNATVTAIATATAIVIITITLTTTVTAHG